MMTASPGKRRGVISPAQFWRLGDVDLRFRDPRQSADPEAAQSIVDARLSGLATAVDQYLARTDVEPAWREAALFSESALELTADELAAFTRAYLDLLS